MTNAAFNRPVLLLVSAIVITAGPSACGSGLPAQAHSASQTASAAAAVAPEELDRLLAPVALYPDQLLAQILLCAMEPAGVTALDQFLKAHPKLKGTDLQDAVLKDNFEPSFVALALFPQTVTMMAGQLDRTTRLGQAFAADKTAVFASIQRLRKQAKDAGNLKTTPQQAVETQTTSTGDQVIVIEPANPQVIYVPQYNSQTVYVQPASTTVVVQQSSSSTDAAVAGVIGFTAGIAIGAAINNNYYYGPYGWHGGAYMYNDAWDDYADHREDAREDWQDHREDIADERGDRAGNAQEQRTERSENRQENRPESQQQRADPQQSRSDTKSQGGTSAQAASTSTRGSGSYESRGQSQGQSRAATQDRSGKSSDAFSGYSSGKSERAASSRGQSSRQSSSRSRSGGGRRR
jgi:Protein of unknown function (DUF3300)